MPESKQGKYQRSGVLWSDEALNRKVARHIRENASVKGQPNLTVGQFCQWVNDDLLPNETLEPGFPRKISIETARKWMVELGFSVVQKEGYIRRWPRARVRHGLSQNIFTWNVFHWFP